MVNKPPKGIFVMHGQNGDIIGTISFRHEDRTWEEFDELWKKGYSFIEEE